MNPNIYKKEDVIDVLKAKDYIFFDNGKSFNPNIIGVRTTVNNDVNAFDDIMCLIYRDIDNILICENFKMTTSAGLYWLNNPMNPRGTIIMKEGQYLGAYKMGLHRGEYKALVQAKPISFYVDNNKDNVIDIIPSSIETGIYGANIHRSNPYQESTIVDKWSAGCQVLANPKDYNKLMNICSLSIKDFGDYFTYTLLLDTDFK
jgi:hypothetical protein